MINGMDEVLLNLNGCDVCLFCNQLCPGPGRKDENKAGGAAVALKSPHPSLVFAFQCGLPRPRPAMPFP